MEDHDDTTCPTCAEWVAFSEPYRLDPPNETMIVLPPLNEWPENIREAHDHHLAIHPSDL